MDLSLLFHLQVSRATWLAYSFAESSCTRYKWLCPSTTLGFEHLAIPQLSMILAKSVRQPYCLFNMSILILIFNLSRPLLTSHRPSSSISLVPRSHMLVQHLLQYPPPPPTQIPRYRQPNIMATCKARPINFDLPRIMEVQPSAFTERAPFALTASFSYGLLSFSSSCASLRPIRSLKSSELLLK